MVIMALYRTKQLPPYIRSTWCSRVT